MGYPIKQLSLYLTLLLTGAGLGILSRRPPQDLTPSVLTPSPTEPLSTTILPTVAPSTAPAAPTSINFIAEAAQAVGPAVVRIDAGQSPPENPDDPPFFRRFFPEDAPPPQRVVPRGIGSGFILSADGRLMTNAHVVEGADWVQVTLKDGRVLRGQVVGRDSITDIAAVKVESEDELPVVRLGRSERLIPGEWAIAIGNPLGLDNTVTVGIISALDRSSTQVGVPDKRVSFIQTDAAINPGNSGGPLLNAQGEVIGVNTAIRADAQGLGFAIPIETAIRIADQLFNNGKVQHPYLGIEMVTFSPDNRQKLNESAPQLFRQIDQEQGVIVLRVVERSPAQAAGFQAGDVILKVGDVEVNTAAEVQQQVERSRIGQPLRVEVQRRRGVVPLMVRPGAFPTQD
ncbi:HhoA/HhoB/HtrA family serine endopeptidase [Spirulina sp. CCNP1310]|uniref:HhoA/HhoB/HtrA family serine endopeptidase n=1 Tax=Spirulina sp. CCNP1310 TaxID=3110249 RepID=UPI002B204E75|nr:HhoA/HhoB/HtrA family serine endopeptidase [Spirulina sp. CCNP1310]MEA5418545.1 HhoA/HhoB/HtrA family serine endopeptidase [Spirulina sp. CCNP1310]